MLSGQVCLYVVYIACMPKYRCSSALGYFTSRPALKGYVREMNSLLQVCKQMEAIGMIGKLSRKTDATTRLLSECSDHEAMLKLC